MAIIPKFSDFLTPLSSFKIPIYDSQIDFKYAIFEIYFIAFYSYRSLELHFILLVPRVKKIL